jgi:hypothetical protein
VRINVPTWGEGIEQDPAPQINMLEAMAAPLARTRTPGFTAFCAELVTCTLQVLAPGAMVQPLAVVMLPVGMVTTCMFTTTDALARTGELKSVPTA